MRGTDEATLYENGTKAPSQNSQQMQKPQGGVPIRNQGQTTKQIFTRNVNGTKGTPLHKRRDICKRFPPINVNAVGPRGWVHNAGTQGVGGDCSPLICNTLRDATSTNTPPNGCKCLCVSQLQKAESFAQCCACIAFLQCDSHLGSPQAPPSDTYNPHPMYYSPLFSSFS